eukprot:scaffold288006_cov33-Tisochrysis_lutea.AAC.2
MEVLGLPLTALPCDLPGCLARWSAEWSLWGSLKVRSPLTLRRPSPTWSACSLRSRRTGMCLRPR